MITQKGLKENDVFALTNDHFTEAWIQIGIPECEKFTAHKEYTSADELHAKLGQDISEFIHSHRHTTFTVAMEQGEENEEPVNDSWSAILNDLKDDMSSKFPWKK